MALLSEVILRKQAPNYEEIERRGSLEAKKRAGVPTKVASSKRKQEVPGERRLVQVLDKVK